VKTRDFSTHSASSLSLTCRRPSMGHRPAVVLFLSPFIAGVSRVRVLRDGSASYNVSNLLQHLVAVTVAAGTCVRGTGGSREGRGKGGGAESTRPTCSRQVREVSMSARDQEGEARPRTWRERLTPTLVSPGEWINISGSVMATQAL
jgi:hypothetical protein